MIAARWLAFAATLLIGTAQAHAEANALRVAKQYGLGYIQLMIMEDQKLIEKYAKQAGLGDIKVEWSTFRSSDVMNDALISGSLDFASLGPTGLITIWSKTQNNIDIRAASGLNAMPWMLNVRGDTIKSIKDFKDTDKIAVPAIKVSGQATALEMAAAQAWGDENFEKLDKLTVSLSHPDATGMMLGGKTEIVANFSSPPYQQIQLKDPNIHTILTSEDILGGPISFNVMATSGRFRKENPKLYKAFLDALEDATTLANSDKDKALDIYQRLSGDKTPKGELLTILNDETSHLTTAALNIGAFSTFLGKVGRLKNPPADWKKEMLFPEAQAAAR